MASKREYRLEVTFDGENVEEFEQFWHHYELTARQNVAAKIWNDEDDAPKLLAIEKQLRGKASLFVRGLPEAKKNTVQVLYEPLRKKYINPRATQTYALAFDQATQQPREELDDFLRRLQRMAGLGFPSSNENDERVTRRFISGIINEKVRLRLLEKGFYKQDGTCESPENVLAAAQEFSSILQTSGEGATVGALRRENDTLRQRVDELARKVQNLEAGAKQYTKSKPNQRRPPANKSVRCWYPPCGKVHPGGWVECRLRKQREPTWNPSLLRSPNSRAVQKPQDSGSYLQDLGHFVPPHDDSDYLN